MSKLIWISCWYVLLDFHSLGMLLALLRYPFPIHWNLFHCLSKGVNALLQEPYLAMLYARSIMFIQHSRNNPDRVNVSLSVYDSIHFPLRT